MGAIALDRGTLAKINRRILSELDHEEAVQLVKVTVSDAVWTTWRRYCEVAEMPMGRGLAILVHHELASVVNEDFEYEGELLRCGLAGSTSARWS